MSVTACVRESGMLGIDMRDEHSYTDFLTKFGIGQQMKVWFRKDCLPFSC